jgi:hypothetical protein
LVAEHFEAVEGAEAVLDVAMVVVLKGAVVVAVVMVV